MTFKLLILSIIIAVAVADNNCEKEKANGCLENYVNALLGNFTLEETCSKMIESVACLRSFVDECLEDAGDQDFAEGLAQIDRALKETCSALGGDTDDYDACVYENREYLFHCVQSSTEETTIPPAELISEDEARCRNYEKLGQCLVDRTVEKCGAGAGSRARQDLRKLDLPWINKCTQSQYFNSVETESLKRRR